MGKHNMSADHDKCLRFVLPPQCYTWHGKARCERKASVYLFAPDGTPNPGGWVCQEHADETVTEHRDKLGEHWTYWPLIIESVARQDKYLPEYEVPEDE